MIQLQKHIVQSELWGQFKQSFGTQSLQVGDLLITKHKIPFLPYYVGYCARVNFFDQKFGWNELKQVSRQHKIAFIRFDVPNITTEQIKRNQGQKILQEIKTQCVLSPRSTFAKWNVLLDLTKSEQQLIEQLNQKTRYNVRLASKKGVTCKIQNDEQGFEIFFDLLSKTAKRQKYLIHPKSYYKKLFDLFRSQNMLNILVCYHQEVPLASWLLLNYADTLYYPYGGSADQNRNTMASNLIAWEAIKLGQNLNCKVFDMWGATNDKNDPWWGFTHFKLGYGGQLVEYINTYDFVVNKFIYYLFNFSYNTFWGILKFIRGR